LGKYIRNSSEEEHHKISTEKDKIIKTNKKLSVLVSSLVKRKVWIPSFQVCLSSLLGVEDSHFSLKSKHVRLRRAACRLSPVLPSLCG
jgi:hypothetical protein